jgi:hypothetical protein
MWARKNYEEAANQVAEMFISSNGKDSINQLSTKIASLHNLNPEGIRTLVRLANVSAFEKTFAKRAEEKSPDRMIEYEVGDPEVVINNLHKEALENVPEEKTAYDRTQDYYGDIEKQTEKIAEEIVPEPEKPEYTAAAMKYAFVKSRERVFMASKQLESRWADQMDKAAQLARTGIRFVADQEVFEKNAAATLGETILPELRVLRSMVTPPDSGIIFGGVKVAEVLDKHVAVIPETQRPIISLLKEARETRVEYENCRRSIEWIDKNSSRFN